MVDVAEGVGPGERLHDLLLVMTGRVDDDAVNAVREMLGGGQLDTAAEFLAGCLLAGRIPVTPSEQHHLRRVLDEVRSDHGLVDRLHVVESAPVEEHRFSEQYESDRDLVDALERAAGRLNGVRALWCTWRTTPAGVTYGAVPRRVLLAEVGSEGSVTAAGYQLVEALRRAGIGCSVDVFESGADLPEYHRDALAGAHRVHLDLPPVSSSGSSRARASRASSSSGSPGGRDLSSEPPGSAPEPGQRPEAGVQGLETGIQGLETGIQHRSEPVDDELPELADQVEDLSDELAEPEFGTPEIAGTGIAETGFVETGLAETEEVEEEPEAEDSEAEERDAGKPDAAEPEAAKSEVELAQPDPAGQEGASEVVVEEHPREGGADESNMRVPAAVDAKLTDRERNLLRKLHEELAQREQDRGDDQQAVSSRSGQREAWSSAAPGTGDFPPIGATSVNQQSRGQQ